ncbi:MAG: hypothetical protein HND49_17580 [Planctomycetes bacterium]|nr:hypothetical protein [Planctomycetota bacterium]
MALSNDMDVIARPVNRSFGRGGNFERVTQDALRAQERTTSYSFLGP